MKRVLGILGLVCICITGMAQTPQELIDCNEEDFLKNTNSAYTPPKYTLPTRNAWQKWSRRRTTRQTFTYQKNNISLGATTIITAEDIALTPARNLLDLIEVYVPGAYWLNYEEGKVIGMRGSVASRNLRYKVFVDGVNVNQETHAGAINELEGWDMDDIAQIEIIRGASAARYGTGAVAGVILITTKVAGKKKLTRVNAGFLSGYNSMGGNFIHSISSSDLDFRFFGSWRKSAGYTPNTLASQLLGDFPAYGYIGQDFIASPLNNPALSLYGDYDKLPQLKLAAQLKFRKKWDVRLRYTSAGSALNGGGTKSYRQTGLVVDSVTTDANGFPIYNYSREYAELVDMKAFRTRQFTASLGRQWQYLDSVSKKGYVIRAQVSWNTQDYERRGDSLYSFGIDIPETLRTRFSDKNDPYYKEYNFAESTLHARLTGNYIFPIGQIALGGEYTRKNIGVGWGDVANEIRLGDGMNFISSASSKIYNLSGLGGYTPDILAEDFVGTGWYSYQGDVFSELSLYPAKWFNLTATSRLSVHSYSKKAWNHRLSLTFPVNSHHVLQFTGQIAHRFATGEQLYETYSHNSLASPEKFTGLEFNYQFCPSINWNVAIHAYHNKIEIADLREGLWQKHFNPLGEGKYTGIEAEVRYTSQKLTIGANYSKIMPQSVVYSQGNFSDSTRLFTTYFNNNPNQIAKLWARYKFFHNRVTIQANLRGMWDYEYAQKDIATRVIPFFVLLETAADNAEELAEIRAFRTSFEHYDPYALDARLDISASLQISENITVSAYVLNLWSINKARRYVYDNGLQATELGPEFENAGIGLSSITALAFSSQRLKFIEEPLVFGVKLKLTL